MSHPIIITTVSDFEKLSPTFGKESVGFVPTMGCLHAGHLSLVAQAKKENKFTVVSIFVNPKQFGPNEDFDRYPRTFDADVALLKSVGVDYIFHPSASEMYPNGFGTYVSVDEVGINSLEGKSRPGFFRGVATVVMKLFNIVQPTRAYFGQKDAIQCIVIRQMVRDLNMRVNVVICDTKREADGLAMSSRNIYLSPDERAKAATIYKALSAVLQLYQSGERSQTKLKSAVEHVLHSEPAFHTQYVSIVDMRSASELASGSSVQVDAGAVVSVALRLGTTRLIDNIILPPLK